MFCDKCGKEYDDNAQFCPYCGDSSEQEKEAIEKKKKKDKKIRNKKLAIVISSLVVFVGIVIALIIAFSNPHKKIAIKYAEALVLGDYSKYESTLVINYDKAFDTVFKRVNKDEDISAKDAIAELNDSYDLGANNTKDIMKAYFALLHEKQNKDNEILETKARIKDADKLEKKELNDQISALKKSLETYSLEPSDYFDTSKITEGYKIELEVEYVLDSDEKNETDFEIFVVKHKGKWRVIQPFELPEFMHLEYPTLTK